VNIRSFGLNLVVTTDRSHAQKTISAQCLQIETKITITKYKKHSSGNAVFRICDRRMAEELPVLRMNRMAAISLLLSVGTGKKASISKCTALHYTAHSNTEIQRSSFQLGSNFAYPNNVLFDTLTQLRLEKACRTSWRR